MILGKGIDIVKVSRVENLLKNRKEKFLTRVFTPTELEYIKKRNYNSQTISGIFAAKEALSKLIGTGIGRVGWKDIEIIHDKNGKPYTRLYNYGLKISKEMGIERIVLSISHEKEYAVASAIGSGKSKEMNIEVAQHIRGMVAKRARDSHKGSYGKVGIIAGSRGMAGSAYLTTMAGLRSGCGLAYAIAPGSLSHIFSIKLTEAIVKPVEDKNTGHFILESYEEIKELIQGMDVLAIGPGMGVDESRIELIQKMLLNFSKPVVLDADGINCISRGNLDILLDRQSPTVITPHPGELARLLGIDTNTIQEDRAKYCRLASKKYNIITVLKGADSLIGDPQGNITVNTTGNPGMATAGSGDLLTGIIASFIGQGIPPHEASVLGVYCHGLAGDLAKIHKGEYGMISMDILDSIPYAIKLLIED